MLSRILLTRPKVLKEAAIVDASLPPILMIDCWMSTSYLVADALNFSPQAGFYNKCLLIAYPRRDVLPKLSSKTTVYPFLHDADDAVRFLMILIAIPARMVVNFGSTSSRQLAHFAMHL